MARIKYINASELQKLHETSKLIICDIRETDEYNREHILGAISTPISAFETTKINQLSADGSILIFHCQSGNRTKLNEAKFEALADEEVMILQDGITSWKKLGCAITVNNKAPLPLMRQVQIIAGFLILTGVVLGFLLSPLFFLLSGFVGAGLMFAGISGFCGMANLLMLLPYNKCNK